MSLLETIVVGNVFAFILIFSRVGSAIMIMPGIGDSFVSNEIRLLFAVAFSFVLTPVLAPHLPAPPSTPGGYLLLVGSETLLGLFIGTVMRILITALDTAGMIVSMQIGFSNAMVFNPMAGSQGSLIGAVYSMTGVLLLFASDLHHLLLATVFDSYNLFPATAALPDSAGMADLIARVVTMSFKTGFAMAIPFIVIGILLQIGFGLLNRLMPQIQIFFLAMPLQILLGLITLTMVFSAGVLYWLNQMGTTITDFLVTK